MSFWDNVKKFTQPYTDDEYDDYEGDGYEGYDEPEEPVRRRPAAVAAPAESAETAMDFASSYEAPSAPATGFSGQVVGSSRAADKQEVVLFHPTNYNDSSKAADDLMNRKAVIVNLENVDKALARRVVDFLSGCAYALKGTVKKVAQSTYLFCPYNMGVVGDLENVQNDVESYV